MSTIQTKLQDVRERMAQACAAAGRTPDSVTLLAVSKTFSAQDVREAYAAGQRAFGESYVQEAVPKMDALAKLAVEWHFIGPLQGNKTRPVAERFDWVHSVDRERIARRLSEGRPPGKPPLNVCLQVNISGEASKSGVAPEAVPELARQVATLPGLRLRGLMAIPEPTEDTNLQRRRFAQLRTLADSLRSAGLAVDTLSMGMSHDLEAAILEGATMVRVGTAIFGLRPAHPSPQAA